MEVCFTIHKIDTCKLNNASMEQPCKLDLF